MAGHSKWANIKHKKAATDKKRGKLFTRVAKELTMAAREGGGDPEFNTRLRLAIAKANAANMPKDNISRAIKRGTGELEGGELLEIVYEGYAPHGIGIVIEVVTDNRNRAVGEVRHVLNKYGGSLAASGSVTWQFSRKGMVTVTEKVDEDDFFLLVAEAGADDVEFGDPIAVYAEVEAFQDVRTAIEEYGITIDEATLIYDPDNMVELETEQTLQVIRLIEKIEDLDDVQNVYSVLDITEEAMAAIGD